MKKTTFLVPPPSSAECVGDTATGSESRRAFLRKTGNAALFSAMGYTLFTNSARAVTCVGGGTSCSHMIDVSVSGFSWSALSEGPDAWLSGVYGHAVFACSPSSGPSKRMQVDFYAEGYEGSNAGSAVSTSSFEMWAQIPVPHVGSIGYSLPPNADVWVSVCSGEHVEEIITGFIEDQAIMADVLYSDWYNLHLMIFNSGMNMSEASDSIWLSGKVYLKRVSSGYKVGDPTKTYQYSDEVFSDPQYFSIEMHTMTA